MYLKYLFKLKMNELWEMEGKNSLDNYDSETTQEYLIYHKNIEQKLSNKISFPFVLNKSKYTYNNFSYNKKGDLLAILLKNDKNTDFKFLIYNPSKYQIILQVDLNNYITKENFNDFIIKDERNIFFKIFGNLSFLRLNQNTNNIYFLTDSYILLTSLDRKILIFINEKNAEIKYLDDIMQSINGKYLALNLKLSFVNNKNIDTVINNSIPKNIYMDLPSYIFGQNFYFLTYHNKLILIFYIENNTYKKRYILIYFLTYNFEENLIVSEEQKMTFEFCIGDLITENNILSIMAKIKLGYLIIGLSFLDEHFEIILIDSRLKMFKKYYSKLFFVPTKRNGKITVITDLFLGEKYGFIIFDFLYVIAFDLINFDIIGIKTNDKTHENIKSNICHDFINIKKLFPNKYNKILFLEFYRQFLKNSNDIEENDKMYLYLITKKNTKEVKFAIKDNINKPYNNKNIINIIKKFNSKKNKNIDIFNNLITNLNKKELYTYLNFLIVNLKNNKNKNLNENYFAHLLFLIQKIKMYISINYNSKYGCIENLLLLNHDKFFGIYNNFVRYNFTCIKYMDFIEDDLNFLTIHKIVQNNIQIENNDYYFLSVSVNYLLIYQVITIIILLIVYEEKINKNLIQLYIFANFGENYKYIYKIIKKILRKLNKYKTCNPFNNEYKINNYSFKKKILVEYRNNIFNSIKNNLFFESVFILINTNYFSRVNITNDRNCKFIKFILFLIMKEIDEILEHDKSGEKQYVAKIFNLYNINDILYSLDYLNITFEEIYTKFFIKDIIIKFENDNIILIKELRSIILLIRQINQNATIDLSDVLSYVEENTNVDQIIFYLLLIHQIINSENNSQQKNLIGNLIKKIFDIKLSPENIETRKINIELILFYQNLLNSEKNINFTSLSKEILNTYLENSLIILQKKLIMLFKKIFNNKKKNENLYEYIRLKKNDILDMNNIRKISLLKLIKNKRYLIYNNQFIMDYVTELCDIINNIKNIFLILFQENNKSNDDNSFLESLFKKNYKNNNYNDNNCNETISKLLKTFCIYFWLMDSFIIITLEMNNKSLHVSELDKETLFISLLHIFYYYSKKYKDSQPILLREISDYLNFFIFVLNKNKKTYDIINIKMKNILEIYFDQEILVERFGDIFGKNLKNKTLQNDSQENCEIAIFDLLKIEDIQFEIYLKDFKNLFIDDNTNNFFVYDTDINLDYDKKNKYYHLTRDLFNKYNKILNYNKLLELFFINDYDIIERNDIDIYNEELMSARVLFSLRQSTERILKNKLNIYQSDIPIINDINEYILVNLLIDPNRIMSYNETTINNFNSVYTFSNNNIKDKKSNGDISCKNEEVKILKNHYTSLSVDLNDTMKRLKMKNCEDKVNFSESEIKCKYLSMKLLKRFFNNKNLGNKYYVFRRIKALFFINETNQIDNQINIVINENEGINYIQNNDNNIYE